VGNSEIGGNKGKLENAWRFVKETQREEKGKKRVEEGSKKQGEIFRKATLKGKATRRPTSMENKLRLGRYRDPGKGTSHSKKEVGQGDSRATILEKPRGNLEKGSSAAHSKVW